jgi:hypothetical protein
MGFDIALFAMIFTLAGVFMLLVTINTIVMKDYLLAGLFGFMLITTLAEGITYFYSHIEELQKQLSIYLFIVVGVFIFSYLVSLYILQLEYPNHIEYIGGIIAIVIASFIYKVHLRKLKSP